MGKSLSGTREWAEHKVNVITGCEHDCRYCYARANAVRFKRRTRKNWHESTVNASAANKSYGKRKGRIMFPTAHDITPATLAPCLWALHKMLAAGNEVLIVSKPHPDCIDAIMTMALANGWKDQILFRFTIGGVSEDVLQYWEPSAPCYTDRVDALRRAWLQNFATSVSAEPLLEWDKADKLIKWLGPMVTDAIWIGKMNHVRLRVPIETDEDERRVKAIEEGQTDEVVRAVYERHKDNKKIKWKEGVKDVVGLKRATRSE